MSKNNTEMSAEDALKMLWIDDSAYYMGDVCNGFIKKVAGLDSDKVIKPIKHNWWQLGNHYKGLSGKRADDDLESDCEYLKKVSDFQNNTEENYINRIIKKIKSDYNAVAIDLLLDEKDIDRFYGKNGDPPLSVTLYHELTEG